MLLNADRALCMKILTMGLLMLKMAKGVLAVCIVAGVANDACTMLWNNLKISYKIKKWAQNSISVGMILIRSQVGERWLARDNSVDKPLHRQHSPSIFFSFPNEDVALLMEKNDSDGKNTILFNCDLYNPQSSIQAWTRKQATALVTPWAPGGWHAAGVWEVRFQSGSHHD